MALQAGALAGFLGVGSVRISVPLHSFTGCCIHSFWGIFGSNGSSNGKGNGGGGNGAGGHGAANNDGEGNRKNNWIVLIAALDVFLLSKPCYAVLIGSCTRKTFTGDIASKYAQILQQACRRHGYDFYDEPYKLNIIGIRNPSDTAGAFDDHFAVVYRTTAKESSWMVTVYKASVDPGRAWLMTKWGGTGGTAILCPGQYKDAYKLGMHKNQYEALCQRLPVRVWRDYDRDGKLDFGPVGSFDEEGMLGINIHHAGIKDSAEYNELLKNYSDMVEKYSAGCQVVATIDDFKDFMQRVHMSIKQGHGPHFTYTIFQGGKVWEDVFHLVGSGSIVTKTISIKKTTTVVSHKFR